MCARNSISSFTKWTHFHKDYIGLTNHVSKNSRTLSKGSLRNTIAWLQDHIVWKRLLEKGDLQAKTGGSFLGPEKPQSQGVGCWRSTSCRTRMPSVCPSSLPAKPPHTKTCTDLPLHQSTSLSWSLRRSPKEYVQINRRFLKSLRTCLKSPNLSVLTSGHLVLYPQHVTFHTLSGVEKEEWMQDVGGQIRGNYISNV